jgi:hypothetical protein
MTISRMQQPRQMYGLGSLVKKAVKGVKKVVKSPLGKAAILGTSIIPGGAKLLGGQFFKKVVIWNENLCLESCYITK